MRSRTPNAHFTTPLVKVAEPEGSALSQLDGAILLVAGPDSRLNSMLAAARAQLDTRPWLSLCVVTDYSTWRGLQREQLARETGHPGVVAIPADGLDEATTRRARRAVDAAVAAVRPDEVVRYALDRLQRPRAAAALEELLALPADQADPSRQRSLRRHLRKHTSMGILEWTHLIRLARCPRLGRSVGAIAADLAITTVTLRKWTQHLLGMPPSEFAVRPGLLWVLQLALQRSGALTA